MVVGPMLMSVSKMFQTACYGQYILLCIDCVWLAMWNLTHVKLEHKVENAQNIWLLPVFWQSCRFNKCRFHFNSASLLPQLALLVICSLSNKPFNITQSFGFQWRGMAALLFMAMSWIQFWSFQHCRGVLAMPLKELTAGRMWLALGLHKFSAPLKSLPLQYWYWQNMHILES